MLTILLKIMHGITFYSCFKIWWEKQPKQPKVKAKLYITSNTISHITSTVVIAHYRIRISKSRNSQRRISNSKKRVFDTVAKSCTVYHSLMKEHPWAVHLSCPYAKEEGRHQR